MYSIGEFSRISGLSIKALRLYHESGLLIPCKVDSQTGYRYYDHKNVERARIICRLRELDFSLDDIGKMLKKNDDSDVIEFFEKQRDEILSRICRQKKIIKSLDSMINKEKEALMSFKGGEFEVEEKQLDKILIAGIRYKGKYTDCGRAFGKIAKKMGRNICGKPFNLYYDDGFKEDGADIETCMPVRKGKEVDGINVRELGGGNCVSLIHKGPYETIGRSYEKIVGYINDKGYKYLVPSREIYIKGPGMILKGKPENYLTEIQILIDK